MALIALYLAFVQQDLLLPTELGFANYVIFDEDDIFILDSISEGIYRLDKTGRILARHNQIGYGPGEVLVHGDFTVKGDRVYLLDHKQRKLITLNRNLEYIGQKFLPSGGVCTNFDTANNSFFFYYYQPSNGMVIHKFDGEMNKIASFCPTFEEGIEIPSKDSHRYHFSYGNGHLRIFNQRLYVMHSFRYRVDVFNLDGELLQSHPIPGVKPQDFLNEEKQGFDVMARGLRLDNKGNVYFALGNRYPNPEKGIQQPLFLMLAHKTGQWRRRPLKSLWFFPYEDRFARTIERETDGRILLRFEPHPFPD